MNKLFKLQIGLITAVIFMVVVTSPVLAGIGISPASLLNNQLKPGTTFRQEISISQSDPEVALNVTVEPDIQGINDWFSFEPGATFQIEQGQKNATVTLVLNIPANAELKDYTGFIRVKATPVGAAALGGVAVVKGARLDVNLTVTESDLVDLLVRSIEAKPADKKGNIVLGLRIENRGNVAAAPSKVELAVEDLNQNPVGNFTTTELEQISVSETKEIQAVFPNDLAVGEYFANVKVYLNDTVLREEKIVIKIEEGEDDQSVSDVLIDSRYLVSAAVLVVGAVAIFLATRSILRRMVLIGPRKKLFLQLVAVGIYILVAAAILYLVLFYVRPTGDVQGIASDRPDLYEVESRGAVQPLPETFNQTRKYTVYANPDSKSLIIKELQEGEQLLVLEETSEWYKVAVGGSEGWLRKADVKQINQEIIPD